MTNTISLPESAITRHGVVEFGIDGDHRLVRCEEAWYRIAEADYGAVLARRQADPTCDLRVRRTSDCWLTFYIWDGRMMRIEVPILCLIDADNWSMTNEVTIPEFSPERLVAQDPDPELTHPFAFVEKEDAKGYFVRGEADGEEVWVRISKEHWDLATLLFHSNEEDDPEGLFYRDTTFPGVVANDEYRRVLVDVDPCGERGEVWVKVRYCAAEADA